MLQGSYHAELNHLLQYMTIIQMTNWAFCWHFWISPPTHLTHVDEMEVLWIMTHEVSLDISRKIQLIFSFKLYCSWTIKSIHTGRRRFCTKIITQRVRCECSDLSKCVPKPSRRVLRRQNDAHASSLSRP